MECSWREEPKPGKKIPGPIAPSNALTKKTAIQIIYKPSKLRNDIHDYVFELHAPATN